MHGIPCLNSPQHARAPASGLFCSQLVSPWPRREPGEEGETLGDMGTRWLMPDQDEPLLPAQGQREQVTPAAGRSLLFLSPCSCPFPFSHQQPSEQAGCFAISSRQGGGAGESPPWLRC